MPCTNNLANFPELVKPQILEENLLSPLCYSSIIPNYMLGLILYTQINVAITPHQNSFSLQKMETLAENYN